MSSIKLKSASRHGLRFEPNTLTRVDTGTTLRTPEHPAAHIGFTPRAAEFTFPALDSAAARNAGLGIAAVYLSEVYAGDVPLGLTFAAEAASAPSAAAGLDYIVQLNQGEY